MDRNSTEIPVLLPLFCVEICKGIPVPVGKKTEGAGIPQVLLPLPTHPYKIFQFNQLQTF